MQIGAATCILGKIGYGSLSESLVHGKPFVFVRRDFFNEEPFLRKQLEIYGLAVEIKRRDFLQGNWHAFLQHASTLKSTYRYTANTATASPDTLQGVWGCKRADTCPRVVFCRGYAQGLGALPALSAVQSFTHSMLPSVRLEAAMQRSTGSNLSSIVLFIAPQAADERRRGRGRAAGRSGA